MSAAIRAKFRVNSVDRVEQWDKSVCETVYLSAVYSEDPANPNHQWSKATPSGNLTISITNPGAQGKLTEGDEYYIDFVPVKTADKDTETGDLFSGD